MVLPVKPIADSKGSQVARNGDRRQSYFGIIRADGNSVCQDKRRAVCSWYGYGTIKENSISKPLKSTILLENQNHNLMTTLAAPHAATTQKSRWPRSRVDFLAMPELKSLVNKRRNSGSGLEADSSSPLVQSKPSSSSVIRPSASLASLKKCEMLLASTGLLKPAVSTNSTEKLQPTNRLRVSPTGSTSRLCSRCSSLLTLASSSRYSLNVSTGGFEPVTEETRLLCKLCLTEVPSHNIYRLKQCDCSFCMQCMKNYVEFEIVEGAYDISCPDAQCPSQGVLQLDEIEKLVGSETLGKHKKYRLNREVELDKSRTWCPRAGCETVCDLCPTHPCSPHSVHCPTCTTEFCSSCKLEWHPGLTCDENAKKLAKEGKVEDQGIPFDSDLIKCCPMCNVPIEKDEGCAQMMCKRCKHVFCWYCLASLDDDFLLRHYDKGPCKNKLGHSRASVIWHRTQVIGIFAGLGILLLVASPLLLLAAPCIVCCKCRVCNPGNSTINNDPEVPDDQT